MCPSLTTTTTVSDGVEQQTTATGEIDEFSYARNAAGNVVTTVVHKAGMEEEAVTYVHDEIGRLVSIVDPYEDSSSFGWEGGSPTDVESRRGASANATYSDAGVPTEIELPDPASPGMQAGSVSATYCGPNDPRPLTETDAAGVVTKYSVDGRYVVADSL
ncbi:MAG: hypothetical protein V9E94_04805 [Microthrixaceae bacterium]